MSLLDFTILLPAILGSLTTIVMFGLVRNIGGKTAGLFSALLFAFTPAIISRGNLGWFKSEPLGLFLGLLSVYLFLSAMKGHQVKLTIIKAVGAGILLDLRTPPGVGFNISAFLFHCFLYVYPLSNGKIKFQYMLQSPLQLVLLSAGHFQDQEYHLCLDCLGSH